MNPILQALQQKQQSPQSRTDEISRLADDIRSGRLDPRAKALQMIAADPSLKAKITRNMGMLTGLARQFGVSDAEINGFISELNGSG